MWDLFNQIGYQASRAGNAVQNLFGGGVSTDPNEYDVWGVKKDLTYANDPKAKAAYEKALSEGRYLVDAGYRSAEENETAARAAADRWLNDPFRVVTEPLDNFLTGNPVGQAVAPAVASGAGYSTAGGYHAGMAAPTNQPTQPNYDQIVNNAANDYNQRQASPVPSPVPALRDDGKAGYVMGQQAATPQPFYPTPNGKLPANQLVQGPPPVNPATGRREGEGGLPQLPQLPEWAPHAAGAVIGAGGSLLASQEQSSAAKDAAQIIADATKSAAQLQKDQYDQTRNDYAPWRAAGEEALSKLKTFDQDYGAFNFQQDPSYTFRLNEGLKALQNSAAAHGGLLSGNTLKAINNYGQESASQEYQAGWNRWQSERGQRLNNLQSLAGVGQTAVQQVNSAGQNYANQAGSAAVGGANALARGRTDAANANASGYMGGANALTNAISSGINYMQDQGYLNALRGGR